MLAKKIFTISIGALVLMSMAQAYASMTIPMYMTDANGQAQSIGSVKAEDAFSGVLFTPDLHGLTPGVHGFHIHEMPSCDDKGMAAGGHLDPQKTQEHNGPYVQHSHLGDLPLLIVDQEGKATTPTLAPRFKLSTIKNHTLMIHAGGDNYSDKPVKLGGGGDRIACGVIK